MSLSLLPGCCLSPLHLTSLFQCIFELASLEIKRFSSRDSLLCSNSAESLYFFPLCFLFPLSSGQVLPPAVIQWEPSALKAQFGHPLFVTILPEMSCLFFACLCFSVLLWQPSQGLSGSGKARNG